MNDSASQQRRRGRPPLVTTERIVDAGIALTLPALSMKRVAEALGVSEMTLYRHVDNLAGLRRTVAQGIWARTDFPAPSSPDPRRALLELAEAMRAMASRHPGIGAYLLNLDPGAEVILRAIERHQAAWAERYGWSPERASLVVTTVTSCAVALGELAAPAPGGNRANSSATRLDAARFPTIAAGRRRSHELGDPFAWTMARLIDGLLAHEDL